MVWAVSLSTMKLSPHCLTPGMGALAFAVWLDLVGFHPLAHPELYLQSRSPEAAPRGISGRTSYLLVRLAFHLYPQLIQPVCNLERFGPPRNITPASPWPWVAHQVSGLLPATFALFRLAFAAAPHVAMLNLATKSNSPAHSSIGTPSPRRGGTPTACRHAVSVLFHSPPGVLFTFPSRYLFTIGHQGYLALGSGLPCFPRGSTCPVVLRITGGSRGAFAYGAVTRSGGPFQGPSTSTAVGYSLRTLQRPIPGPATPPEYRPAGH